MKFHHTDGPHCLYLSTDRNLGSFSSLAIVNMPAKHPSLCCADTESFRNTPKSGMAGSYGCLIFRFLRKLHTAFHGSCTSLRSYRHWARVQFLYILICCLFSWWQPCWLLWVKSPKAALIDMLATFLTVPTVWPPCQQDTSLCSLNAWWPLGPPSLRPRNRLHRPLFLYECSFDWKQILYMAETTKIH